VLLIGDEHEVLLRHPQPPEDFTHAGYDETLRSDVYVRPRQMPPNLLATFPISGVPTAVVGPPEPTGKSSTQWVLTLLHEHFHQLQYTQPDYYDATGALDLARHDTTGMWMLNYPFPYDSTALAARFAAVQQTARQALDAIGTEDFAPRLSTYRAARELLNDALAEDDYRYLSFQLWQEGIARHTEYRVAHAAAAHHTPSNAFLALDDATSYEKAADAIYDGILQALTDGTLAAYKRVAFYALGAAEGLLLDAARPDWHRRYFDEKFFSERYFEAP